MKINIVHSSSYVTKELPEGFLNVGSLFDAVYLKDAKSSFFILCNGRKVEEDFKLEDGKTYHIIPRLPGGKGGFGSMLRAIGAQIEKTTSREACRDLSGRRMRDINNEKKLKEWLAKEAEREQEREQRKQERLQKQLQKPQHKFDDTEYHEQRAKMQEDLQDAVSKGLKRTHKEKHSYPDKKLKTTARTSGISKTEWIGVDIESESSCNSDSEANPGDPNSSDGSSGSKDMDCHASSSCSSHKLSDKKMKANHPHSSLDIDGSLATAPHECVSAEDKQVHDQMSNNSTNCADDAEISIENKPPQLTKNEVSDSNEPIDLDRYSSSEDLAKLGMERLKNALMTRGLKCGGTLDERADRLFSVKGLSSDQIDPSLFAKLKGKGKKSK